MQTYTYGQVRDASVRYFNGDELAGEVFAGKYALQDLEGNFYELTPTDMHRRLAKEFARIEAKYPNPMSEEEIFSMLCDWSIVPQGSPMSGIGNLFQLQSLSNCFVVDPPQDSYGGIFRADQEQAQIMKRRGGVGHDISCIRPKGKPAANAARTTDGIAVFMDRFSNTTREVAQNGRRGALMLSISVKHPEIGTFIDIKKDKKRVTGANISIRATDDFMAAVRDGTTYVQQWPVDAAIPVYKQEVDARKVWDQMMLAAWDSAEPGILYWDTIIKGSPADCYADLGYRTSSTNPCGELPLSPYDSCRLILMNLMKFVIFPYTPLAAFDYTKFDLYVFKAQRLMDDLVDLELEVIDQIITKVESDPEPDAVKRIELELWHKIKRATSQARRTGLGITGLGDALAALGIKYGSEDSIVETEQIYRQLAVSSYTSSIWMAKERGAFPIWDFEREKDHPFIRQVMKRIGSPAAAQIWMKHGRRNIANLTTSPAGTVSIVTQTTSGGESAFMIDYTRRKKINPNDKQARVDFVDPSGDKWQEYKVYHHGHETWARVNGKDPERDIAESPYYGATAADIDWIKKVEIQAAAQRWVDHSISNTTNVPKDTPVEVVKQIYMKGWELGCKGITIYREGSRSGVLVASGDGDKAKVDGSTIRESRAPKRPLELPCNIHRMTADKQKYLILVGLLDGKPYEVFCGLAENFDVAHNQKGGVLVKRPQESGLSIYDLIVGASGSSPEHMYEDVVNLFDNPNYGAFTRTISTALRHGVPIHYLVEQLRKDKHSDMWSFSTVLARTLSKSYVVDGTVSTAEKSCRDCGSNVLSYQQGCVTCMGCGSGKCS